MLYPIEMCQQFLQNNKIQNSVFQTESICRKQNKCNSKFEIRAHGHQHFLPFLNVFNSGLSLSCKNEGLCCKLQSPKNPLICSSLLGKTWSGQVDSVGRVQNG